MLKTLLMMALAWKHNRLPFGVVVTLERNCLLTLSLTRSITMCMCMWFHVTSSFCTIQLQNFMSRTSYSTLEFLINWLLNVNALYSVRITSSLLGAWQLSTPSLMLCCPLCLLWWRGQREKTENKEKHATSKKVWTTDRDQRTICNAYTRLVQRL